MKIPHSILLASALLAGGCLATGAFIPTGDQRFSPRSPECTFSLYTIPPEGFVEVGLVQFHGGPYDGAFGLGEARQLAAPHVCAAGGDGLVVPHKGGEYSVIPRATIIRRVGKADGGVARD